MSVQTLSRQLLEIDAAATAEHIDLRLAKGGGFTGTITNEYGKPVALLEVRASVRADILLDVLSRLSMRLPLR